MIRSLPSERTRSSSVTTGQIYQEVLAKERKGDFLGGTIQPIPHVTNEIKERIEQAKDDWKAGRFGTVPGDETEFIPLP